MIFRALTLGIVLVPGMHFTDISLIGKKCSGAILLSDSELKSYLGNCPNLSHQDFRKLAQSVCVRENGEIDTVRAYMLSFLLIDGLLSSKEVEENWKEAASKEVVKMGISVNRLKSEFGIQSSDWITSADFESLFSSIMDRCLKDSFISLVTDIALLYSEGGRFHRMSSLFRKGLEYIAAALVRGLSNPELNDKIILMSGYTRELETLHDKRKIDLLKFSPEAFRIWYTGMQFSGSFKARKLLEKRLAKGWDLYKTKPSDSHLEDLRLLSEDEFGRWEKKFLGFFSRRIFPRRVEFVNKMKVIRESNSEKQGAKNIAELHACKN